MNHDKEVKIPISIKIPIRVCHPRRTIREKAGIFSMFKVSLIKIAALLLIVSLNWSALLAVGKTFGFFSDTENSFGNFIAGTLDFSLDSQSSSSACLKTGTATTTITIINNGNPFKYAASSTNFSSELCDYVILKAFLDGELKYEGNLKDFAFGPEEFSDPENWEFVLSLPTDLPSSVQGQTCDFNIIFFGSQTRHDLPLGEGFSDTEDPSGSITAPVCHTGETRTIGYWKNHSSVYIPYLPQELGGIGGEDLLIESKAEADAVFNADDSIMRNKLRKQLLAMKFNIAHFDVGDYFVGSEGKTLSEIVAEADALLYQDPPPVDSILEDMKDILNYWNQDHSLRICVCDQGGSQEPKIVINKVYYDVDSYHGIEGENEWVELYNPTKSSIDISNWIIADNNGSDILASTSPLVIPALGYAVITASSSTFNYWAIPDDVLKIILEDGRIGNGLNNDNEMLVLKNSDGKIIDQMNWGTPDPLWPNYNADIWNPGVEDVDEGHMLARYPNGFDTDKIFDWKELAPPEVLVTFPNGGEVWYVGRTYNLAWEATNPNGPDSDLNIDLFYSGDSGKSWGTIATSTENDGIYKWRVPLFLDGYYVPSPTARIKVVAYGPENFMAQGSDMSDEDFCPPIDYSLLTLEEIEWLRQAGLMEEQIVAEVSADENLASLNILIEDNIIMDDSTSTDENATGTEEVITTGGGGDSETIMPEEQIGEPETFDVPSSFEEQLAEEETIEESEPILEEEPEPMIEPEPVIAPDKQEVEGDSDAGQPSGDGSGDGSSSDSFFISVSVDSVVAPEAPTQETSN